MNAISTQCITTILAVWVSLVTGWCSSSKNNYEVSISVSVLKSDNTPVSNLLIVANSRDGGASPVIVCGRTGADGIVTLHMTVSSGSHRVVVAPAPIAVGCAAATDASRYDEVLSSNFLEPWKAVMIDESSLSHSITFVAEQSVKVTGTFPHASGQTIELADVRLANHYQIVEIAWPAGTFEIVGAPRNRASNLFASAGGDHWTVIPVSPSATDSEVNLGTLTMATEEAGYEVGIHVSNQELVAQCLESMNEDVTCVRSDGGDVWSFNINASGNAHRKDGDTNKPKLPAGAYFVVPGEPGGANKCACELYRCVKEGRAAELEAAGVPKVTVTTDGQTVLEMDASAAERAVASVAGYQ